MREKRKSIQSLMTKKTWIGVKKVQSHLRSLRACKGHVSESCILEKEWGCWDIYLPTPVYLWARTALQVLSPVVSGLSCGDKLVPIVRENHCPNCQRKSLSLIILSFKPNTFGLFSWKFFFFFPFLFFLGDDQKIIGKGNLGEEYLIHLCACSVSTTYWRWFVNIS